MTGGRSILDQMRSRSEIDDTRSMTHLFNEIRNGRDLTVVLISFYENKIRSALFNGEATL